VALPLLFVSNRTKIHLKNGRIVSPQFLSSRETYIEVDSSSISGSYYLYDLLSIKTKSGSVSIDIDPKPVGRVPAPAVFVLNSRSGSVDVQYPASGTNIPSRDYRTTIISQDGSISGRYLHGTNTVVESRSASIGIEVLPYAADDNPSTLHTKSRSGSSKIEVLSPYLNFRSPIKRLSSTHIAESGQLVLTYPDEWEGKLSGQTTSGSLNLRGSALRVIERGSRGGGHYIVAEKGDGESTMKFNTRSGSVDALVGF